MIVNFHKSLYYTVNM